jgi:hypothetical protein
MIALGLNPVKEMEPPLRTNKKELIKLYGNKVWLKVLARLSPATRMMLAQQVHFIGLIEQKDFELYNWPYKDIDKDDVAVIETSEEWENMVGQKVEAIEKAFYEVRGVKTVILLLK